MEMPNRDFVARALEIAIDGLGPFIVEVLTPLIPAGTNWTDLLEARDRSNGIVNKTYNTNDLQGLLRMVTERQGNLGFPFSTRLSRLSQNLASELREVRNRWAHHDDFSDDDTYRAIDTTERLLRAIGSAEAAGEVAELRVALRPVISAPSGSSTETTSTADAGNHQLGPEPTVPDSDESPEGDPITIQLDAIPVLSYAAAHNRLPIVNSVTILNNGPAHRGAVLRLDASSALGAVSVPFERLIDLSASSSVPLTDLPVLLDSTQMLQIEERRPAQVTATLEFDGQVVARNRVEVEVLAAHQWVRQPANLAVELLAAFVLPNHPAIPVLLGEASDLLMAETGSGSLEGYQADEARVDQIAGAIYRAMQARRIRYSEPPASWGDDGQKIRTPAEVLDGRVGTCLDTTVVMAAAFEQAGLRPLLWLVDGHAFVGYWRFEASLGSAATTEIIDAINQVDLGHIGVVETTLLTERAEPVSFELAARRPIIDYLHGSPQSILAITDVVEARQAKIFPLPARTKADDGAVTVTEYIAPVNEPGRYEEYEKTPGAVETRRAVPYRVSQWKNSLLDLTLRNRLINFTPSARISLAVPEMDVPHLEDLVNLGKDITMLPSDDVAEVMRARGIRYGRDLSEGERTALVREKRQAYADVTEAAYTTRFRNLAYKAKTIEEETGANNLYLAFGTLIWETNNRELSSPLVLVPVKLEPSRGGRYRILHDDSASSTPNYCLLEKLRQTHGLSIPGLAEPADDGAGIDLEAAFRATRLALEAAGLPFRVESSVDLSILQFAKFRLWKDLDDNWEELANNPLVHHLIHSPTSEFQDPNADSQLADLDELGALSPVAADSSQLSAVAAAVGGRTFVLEGPPGTGKSQTITNLLVRAVADGKKVLFVAEKRAALEVVQRRLEEVGLGPFALDLHDKGSRPAAVRAQIKAALQHRVSSDSDGLHAATETLESSRRTLSRYSQRLHETNGAGLSYYSARNRLLSALESTRAMTVPGSLVSGDPAVVEVVRRLFRQLPDVAEPARPTPNHSWSFIGCATGIDNSSVFESARSVDTALDDLGPDSHLVELLRLLPDIAHLEGLAALARAPRYPMDAVDAARKKSWKKAAAATRNHLDSFVVSAGGGLAGIKPEVLDEPLEEIHSQALAADASGFFGRKKRRIAARSRIAEFIDPASLPKPKNVASLTATLLSLRIDLMSLRSEFSALPGLKQKSSWNPLADGDISSRLENRIKWLTWLAEVLRTDSDSPDPFVQAKRAFYSTSERDESISSRFHALAAAFESLQDQLGADERNSLWIWSASGGIVPRWNSNRIGRSPENAGAEALSRWTALVGYVEPLLEHDLGAARSDILSGALLPEIASAAFEKGVASASLVERSQATTLDAFDSEIHELAIGRFTNSSDDVRNSLVKEIPARLVGGRTFDPLSAGGQIGELNRQLDRKVGGLRVRPLLDRFGPLISQLVPCMLMSPESVARFFPVRHDIFDIVVFDEASQIRVADAIGSMGRGASVVVVGDSKQMPPTSFAEVSIGGEDNDRDAAALVQDEESILSECVAAQVPSLALTWHYRSQDESLISFSNERYYGNLSSFPSPLHGSSDDGIAGHGISLVRVNGKFLRSATGKALRTNPVEAEAIVDEIQRRFWGSPDEWPSLGVVTFNAQQRTLIETLLRDCGDPRIVEALDGGSEGLFVKNLENVQGDERDSILFSTAFSANEKGDLPLNFGPVSQAGGERRLNVAITRARRQVVLFSSFDPQDLRTGDTTSIGLKHLRAYLELASGTRSFAAASRFRDDLIDRHREDIANALRLRGIAVTTDVGLSDFRIDLSLASADDPTQPLVAVLLDNPAWAKRKTVSDRDGLPTAVLSNLMRWPAVSRVWMPDWLANREAVIDRLEATLDRARENLMLERLSQEFEADALLAVVATPEPLPESRTPSGGEFFTRVSLAPEPRAATPATTSPEVLTDSSIFKPWTSRPKGTVDTLDRLPSRDARREVEAVIREVVAAEGPIHVVRLSKLVAAAFGLDRVAQARVVSILKCLPAEFKAPRDKAYAWPSGLEPETWAGFRRSIDASNRSFEHVHPAEIVNAMCALVIRGAGLYEDELRRETLRFFGLLRMTPNMTAILDGALKRAIDTGRLEHTASGVIGVPSG